MLMFFSSKQILHELQLKGCLEDQIVLSMVKKSVIDCESSTQCDDDKACMDSMRERGRMLCEPVCER